jgi:hypothetical protein
MTLTIRTAVLAVSLLPACYPYDPGAFGDDGGAGGGQGGTAGSNGDVAGASGGSGGSSPVAMGVPCAVQTLVAARCLTCHGAMPRSPLSLVTRAHFLAPSPSTSTESVGQRSVSRMGDVARPMPPSGVLPAMERAALEQWVQMGMPVAPSCDAVDAGSVAVPDAGPDPYAGLVRCSSGRQWNSGNRGSQHMNPGLACVSCHTSVNAGEGREETPDNIGGTVFLTGREPDLCLGFSGGAVVVVTGADNVELRLPVNTSGNFFGWSTSRVVRPYRARIEYQGRTRQMNTPQMSGDCNSCHTTMGRNNAPGRLVVQ